MVDQVTVGGVHERDAGIAEAEGAIGQRSTVALCLADHFLGADLGFLGFDVGDRKAIEIEQIVGGTGIGRMFLDRIGRRTIAIQPMLVRDNTPAVGLEAGIDEELAGLTFAGHDLVVPQRQ